MIWSEIEIEQSSADHRDCDYIVTDEREGVQTWEAWEVTDEEDDIVAEGRAPDDLADAVEDETRFEVRWPHEVQRTTVVETTVGVTERTAFFAEEPPEDAAEAIGHRAAVRLLEHRGMEVSRSQMGGAWFFPMRRDAGIHVTHTDDAGETYSTYRSVRNLTDEEVALVRGDPDAFSEPDGEMPFRELADRIHDQSGLYERQSQYVASVIRDDETFAEMRDRINDEYSENLSYDDVTASWYKMMNRQEEIAWQVMHVWPHLPEKHRSDEMEMILDALDVDASADDPEWLVSDE